MSDTEPPDNVLALDFKRFKFDGYDFDDETIGLVDEGIVFVTEPEKLAGLIMNPEDAEELGMALIQAAGVYRSKQH